MTYDGIFIKAQIAEILDIVKNEHIAKITEKSQNEIDFHIHKSSKDLILSISVDPNFPHILLSDEDIDSQDTQHAFLMIIRKYLKAGKIINIKQINSTVPYDNSFDTLERVIDIIIENIDDYGEKNTYHLLVEIMGKYSNIIITDVKFTILDTLKKSNENTRLKVKSLYDLKQLCNKKEIFNETQEAFEKCINDYKTLCEINKNKFDIYDAISKIYAGISKKTISEINIDTLNNLQDEIQKRIKNNVNPNKDLNEYIKLKHQNIYESTEKKNVETIIKNLYAKLIKRIDLLNSDIEKTKDFEKYSLYGELISAFGYDKNNIKNGKLYCENYKNNNEKIEIPIDNTIDIAGNIKKYFDKYQKLKRTKEKASELLIEVNNKLEHLDSIRDSLMLSNDKNDIFLIKEEISNYFDEVKKNQNIAKHKKSINERKSHNKKTTINYNIHHYKSTNGIDIYIGKNNLQNDYLTFTMASPDDTWLHIKGSTGSHVIVKKPYTSLDDQTLIEAASLAAYFSDKRNETKATVDYTLRKELKKVKGKAPGFCIYHKNYSINVKPEILIKEI